MHPSTTPGPSPATASTARVTSRGSWRSTGVRYVSIEGRIKDVINRGGEKVNAEEVELLLLRHPRSPTPRWSRCPTPGWGSAPAPTWWRGPRRSLLPEVRAHLEALGVAKFKWPERLEWVDELPKTSVGKLDKKRLREDIARRLSEAERAQLSFLSSRSR